MSDKPISQAVVETTVVRFSAIAEILKPIWERIREVFRRLLRVLRKWAWANRVVIREITGVQITHPVSHARSGPHRRRR